MGAKWEWPAPPPPPHPHEFCRGSRRPCTPRKRRALYPNLLEERGGYAAALPEGCFAGFSTSRTILHAARNGHISISRQRALACRQEGASLLLKSFYPRRLARQRAKSPERAARIQPGVQPPVIQARVSVYRASSARPRSFAVYWQCCGEAAYLSFHLSSSHLSGALALTYLFWPISLTQNIHLPSFFYAEIVKMKIFLLTAFWRVLGRILGVLLAFANFK